MTAGGDRPGAPGQDTASRRQWLALSAERDQWHAFALDMWRAGRAAGIAEGQCPGHHEAVADAFTAGQAAAIADLANGSSSFAVGWNAALDRFGEHIAGAWPAHTECEIAVWTVHAPRCRRGGRGGNQSCQRSGCVKRRRKDYGKPVPWDFKGTPRA